MYPDGLGLWSEYTESTGWGGFVRYDLSLPNIASATVLGDVNHDGYPDAVVSSDEQMALMLGSQRGFQSPIYFDQQTVGGNAVRPAIADIDMDGNPDLITDQGVVLFGHGDGTFAVPQRFDFGFDSEGVTVADMNRDGLLRHRIHRGSDADLQVVGTTEG